MSKRSDTSTRIIDIIESMKQNIKNNISRMRENKNKSRDEFNEIATSIAKGNKQQLEDNKERIKKIIDEYV